METIKMKKLKDMSKDERSLLLFLETRAVDYGGRVNVAHMNSDDMDIAEKWDDEVFLEFGRIVARNHNSDGNHWVKLSKDAFTLAHKERRARSKIMFENRRWISTKDSMEIHGSPRFSNLNNEEGLDDSKPNKFRNGE